MAIHYSISLNKFACGRNNLSLVESPLVKVTCKSCLGTEAYRRDADKVVVKAVVTPKVVGIVFNEWLCKRATNERLPRGRYFARGHKGL